MLKRRTRPGPIGLDIGASGIRMLQLVEDDGQLAIRATAHANLPSDPDDPMEREAAVERAVAEALRRHPFQGRDVVAVLGPSEFQVKNIRLPKMPADELASAVEFEARERFDISDGEAQFRHIAVGEVRHGNETKQEIIVFAVLDEVVRARLRMLESLRLRPSAIDVSPCAVARCFARFLRRAEDAKAINVFLDVGWASTSVVITRGTRLAFLKVVEIGGGHFDNAVAKALAVSKEEAAELRIRIMHETGGRRETDKVTVPEEIRAAVADAVRPLVEKLVRDVQLCLRYFAVTFRGQRPESLTCVGGVAHEPSLLDTLAGGIDIQCMVGYPLRGVARPSALAGPDRRSFQPAWAVACGSALYGSRWVQAAKPRGVRIGA